MERFAPSVGNNGKGKKDSPGFFYGFKGDIWQAYALGVAFLDMSDDLNGQKYLIDNYIS